MDLNDDQIKGIAAMLTDDPDILNEWWGKGPQLTPFQQKLAAATKITDPKRLSQLELEVSKFIQYRPELSAQGEDAILQAFVEFKRTGKLPIKAGLPQNMDRFGGKDFREAKPRSRRLI